MSMLEKFYSVQYANRSDLFEGLFISFVGIKENNFAGAQENICRMVWRQHHSAPCRISLVDITEKSDYPFG
jgi:hypothetical protein